MIRDDGTPEDWTREGMRCLAGIGVPHDAVRAAELFERAALAGHGVAANQWGAMLEHGAPGAPGVPQDVAKAREAYRIGAESNLAIAQFNLGFLLHMGRGGSEDLAGARKMYAAAAAAQDEPTACLNLGILMARGQGGPRDVAEGYRWMERAAELGEAAAAFNLGMIHAGGHDVAVDFVAGMRWFDRARALDHPQAGAEMRKLLAVMSESERNRYQQESA